MLLRAEGLVKYYGRRKVVDGVSLDVQRGEVVGLLGCNGAGKTTTFRMVMGLITPDGGRVILNDTDVTSWPMYRRARVGMGYLSQETSVFRKLTVEENLLAILELLPAPAGQSARKWRQEQAYRLLDQFGLLHLRQNLAITLSGGEKRRLEIARSLLTKPSIILLDEPFTGIDPKTGSDIQQIILRLRHAGIGILLTDHNVDQTLRITDRAYVIYAGRVFASGTPAEIVQNEEVRQRYLGTDYDAEAILMRTPAA